MGDVTRRRREVASARAMIINGLGMLAFENASREWIAEVQKGLADETSSINTRLDAELDQVGLVPINPWLPLDDIRKASVEETDHWLDRIKAILMQKPKARGVDHWERGWRENLEEYRETRSSEALRPKYLRRHGEPIRLNGKFCFPQDPNYEWNWYRRSFLPRVAALWLGDADMIAEFGCGSGHNVDWLAKRFPSKRIFGLDWSEASIEILKELRKGNVSASRFNLLSPDLSFELGPRSVVLTVGAMEQTGKLWRPFLDYLLVRKPMRVVHIEPIVDWYDPQSAVDVSAIIAHKARGFWEGYLDALKELERTGRVRIEDAHRTGVGSLLIEGYSKLIWRPL